MVQCSEDRSVLTPPPLHHCITVLVRLAGALKAALSDPPSLCSGVSALTAASPQGLLTKPLTWRCTEAM